MNKKLALIWIICVTTLTGCGSDFITATVNLNNSATDFGRINSQDLPLGSVLRWNTKTNDIAQLPPLPVPAASIDREPATGAKSDGIKGVSETDITITVPTGVSPLSAIAKSGIVADIGSQTSVDLTNYFHENYLSRTALPNLQSSSTWRQQNLTDRDVNPDIVFVVVAQDTAADEAKFYHGTPQDANGNPKALDNGLTVAGSKIIDVSYTGSSSIDNKGNGIPAIVKYQYFRLEKDQSNASDPYHFTRLSPKTTEPKFVAAVRENGID